MTVLPLPTGLFILTCLSLSFSIAISVLSLVGFSFTSPWLNFGSAVLTIFYQGVLLASAYHKLFTTIPPRSSSAASTAKSIACAYVLFAIWIVAFGMTVQTTTYGPGSPMNPELNARLDRPVQVSQAVLTGMETLVIGAFAIACTFGRNKADLELESLHDEKCFDITTPLTARPTSALPLGRQWKQFSATLDRPVPPRPVRLPNLTLQKARNAVKPFKLKPFPGPPMIR